jgi:ribosomal protein S18 acetylase RimI-like enzyme
MKVNGMNVTDRFAHWRPAALVDIAAIYEIQCIAHADHPEARDVLLERLELCPAGCFVLERRGMISGYALSHPWRRFSPPPIDTKLGQIPGEADTWYLHDLALLPGTRGSGAGAKVSKLLMNLARGDGYKTLALVSVNGSQGFWERQGFSVRRDEALAAKLAGYGSEAVYMEHDLSGADFR